MGKPGQVQETVEGTYFKIVSYRVDCPECENRIWLPNPHMASLIGETVECEECATLIKIVAEGETFSEDL